MKMTSRSRLKVRTGRHPTRILVFDRRRKQILKTRSMRKIQPAQGFDLEVLGQPVFSKFR